MRRTNKFVGWKSSTLYLVVFSALAMFGYYYPGKYLVARGEMAVIYVMSFFVLTVLIGHKFFYFGNGNLKIYTIYNFLNPFEYRILDIEKVVVQTSHGRRSTLFVIYLKSGKKKTFFSFLMRFDTNVICNNFKKIDVAIVQK